ncbi:diguanylate cyclase, partial [Mycobacterium tuberculosis]|nr:diguanylate cyclase [Mycobacterium tuberculosis]
ALAFAQEWRKRIEQMRIAGVPFPITISIGVARSSAGESLDSLYARADRALYVAKTSGRNRVVADEHELSAPDGLWPDDSVTEIAWSDDGVDE